MENLRGICSNCGIIVVGLHECNADIARLVEIDREAGPRSIREIMIADGKKGFNNKIETLEAEAAALRQKIASDEAAKAAQKAADEVARIQAEAEALARSNAMIAQEEADRLAREAELAAALADPNNPIHQAI